MLTTLARLGIDHDQFNQLPALSSLTNLEYLTTENGTEFGKLKEQLVFSNPQISQEIGLKLNKSPEKLTQFDALQVATLNLNYSTELPILQPKLTSQNLDDLALFPLLQELELAKNDITNLAFMTAKLPFLKLLNLRDNHATDLSPLADSLADSSLQRLSLTGNPVHDISPLKEITSLEFLYLSSTNVSNCDTIASLPNLSSLGLSNLLYLDPESLAYALKSTKDLTYLSLNGNRLGTAFTERDLSKLWGSLKLTPLTTLNLQNNQLTDISHLHGLSELKHLDLRNNPINPNDMAELTVSLPNTEITADFKQLKPTGGASPTPTPTEPETDILAPDGEDDDFVFSGKIAREPLTLAEVKLRLNTTKDLSKKDLSGLDLQSLNLESVDLTHTILESCNLTGVNLSHAKLDAANLKQATLTNANLSHTLLRRANLVQAKCIETKFNHARMTKADLRTANLKGADLTDAVLIRANMSGSYLNHAKLTRATMTNIKGRYIDLDHADLSGATLTNSDLSEGSLESSNLTGTDLSGVNLTGTIINGAVFENAQTATTIFTKD